MYLFQDRLQGKEPIEAEFMNVQFHLGFLGIILIFFSTWSSLYIVYTTNQFKTTFAQKGAGEVKSVSRGGFK